MMRSTSHTLLPPLPYNRHLPPLPLSLLCQRQHDRPKNQHQPRHPIHHLLPPLYLLKQQNTPSPGHKQATLENRVRYGEADATGRDDGRHIGDVPNDPRGYAGDGGVAGVEGDVLLGVRGFEGDGDGGEGEGGEAHGDDVGGVVFDQGGGVVHGG